MSSSLCSFSEKTPPYHSSLKFGNSMISDHAARAAANMKMKSSLIVLIVSSVMYLAHRTSHSSFCSSRIDQRVGRSRHHWGRCRQTRCVGDAK